MKTKLNLVLSILVLLYLFCLPQFLPAAELSYKGKVITMITTGTAGGTTDTMARLLSQFYPKFLPGKPRIVVRNSSRGNELVDFNLLYERGKKDGTEIGASSTRITMGELVSLDIRRYDLAKMPLIAAFPEGIAPILNKKIVKNGWKDMIAMGDKFIAGGSGPESLSCWAFMWFKKWLSPNMKIIFGYEKGTARTALLRGETHMLNETTPSALQYWADEKDAAVPFTMGDIDDAGNVVRDPLMPDTPTLLEIYQEAKGQMPPADQLSAYKAFIGCACSTGRAYWLPPGVRPDVMNVFVKGAEDMVKDPGFRKAAGPRIEGYSAFVGERAVRLIKNAFNQPKEAKLWLKNWMATDYNLK